MASPKVPILTRFQNIFSRPKTSEEERNLFFFLLMQIFVRLKASQCTVQNGYICLYRERNYDQTATCNTKRRPVSWNLPPAWLNIFNQKRWVKQNLLFSFVVWNMRAVPRTRISFDGFREIVKDRAWRVFSLRRRQYAFYNLLQSDIQINLDIVCSPVKRTQRKLSTHQCTC